jgi:hypothetical protein
LLEVYRSFRAANGAPVSDTGDQDGPEKEPTPTLR